MAGLQSLITVGGEFWIDNNDQLTDVSPLSSLTTLGLSLYVVNNGLISSLNGLENINPISSLYIFNNPLLSQCDVQSICDYLAIPNAFADIHDNAPGCNNPVQVVAACLTSVESIFTKEEFSIFPNPFIKSTFLEYKYEENSTTTLTIFNFLGQEVAVLKNEQQSKGIHQVQWNAKDLPAGVYYCQLKTGNQVMAKKIIKL